MQNHDMKWFNSDVFFVLFLTKGFTYSCKYIFNFEYLEFSFRV